MYLRLERAHVESSVNTMPSREMAYSTLQGAYLRINQLILASASTHRRDLLTSAGLHFSVQTAPIDEYAITAPMPAQLAAARSHAKAIAVSESAPGALVIGADQVLGWQNRAIDKAANISEARQRLQDLSGGSHILHSAFCLATIVDRTSVILHSEIVDVPMQMRKLSAAEIEAYLATGEWRGCVGCYQAENRGVNLFERMEGDLSSIIGLPLLQLLAALRNLGVDALLNCGGPWELRV